MKRLAGTFAIPLGTVGLIVLLTDWVEWSWWIGLALILPLGVLVVLSLESVAESLGTGDGEGGFDGGDGGGGD